LLVNMGTGTAHLDLAGARELGITVSGFGPRRATPPELTWSLLLGLRRHVAEQEQGFGERAQELDTGADLAGLTLGVIGLERQAALVAAIGRAFRMRVVACSEHLDPVTPSAGTVQIVTRERLLTNADVVMINLGLDDRTRGLISTAQLALLKPTTYLINTSRSPIVDLGALIGALHAGRIAGAGLDVSDIEPLRAEHPLRGAPRTLLMTDIGYVPATGYRDFYTHAVESITAFMAGEPLHVLNR
jgi:phosphoglycerate dehydrogenase-like enzyme